jgi:hypothetical protein
MFFALSGLGPAPALASVLTDVVDAADGDDPFDVTADVAYDRTLRRAKITREFPCDPAQTLDTCDSALPGVGQMVYAKELRIQRITHTLTPRLRFGLYRDLELAIEAPVVIEDTQEVRFAGNSGDPNGVAVDPTISTIAPGSRQRVVNGRVVLGPDGEPVMEDPENLFDVPPAELPTRGGFGDMQLALRWSPYNQERDQARATWLLEFAWRLPTGEVMKADNEGVGRGVHALTAATAVSRRFRYTEPYVRVDGTLHVPSSDSLFKDYRFAQERVGPGAVVGFLVGSEFVPYEQAERGIKLFFDLGLGAHYHAEGRDYSELFDALASGGRDCPTDPRAAVDPNRSCYNPDSNSELAGQAFDGITTVEQFVTAKAHLGFGLQTSQHLRIGTELSLAHDTEHFISTADVGKDLNGTGIVESRADVNWSAEEQNPTYVRSIDALGRRLRVEETTVFNVRMSATLMF